MMRAWRFSDAALRTMCAVVLLTIVLAGAATPPPMSRFLPGASSTMLKF